MSTRQRHHRRRKSWDYGDGAVTIRVGSRRSVAGFHAINVSSAEDTLRFLSLIRDQVREDQDLRDLHDPLIISINGYQPWLEQILGSCIHDYWRDVAGLGREVQFAGTMQFPQKASKRGHNVPWTFIIDHMNMPQVYYWSVGLENPATDNIGLPPIEHYRFRTGVWHCGRGACRFDRDKVVVIIFTRPTSVCEHVVTTIMFDFLYRDQDLAQPREDEEGVCWTFSRLYWLLTDWQNIILAIAARLDEAEANSHGRNLPVKWRTRMLHIEVDRLYELKEYLRFHSRSFKKLQRLKSVVPQQEQNDPLWDDMDDVVEDLEQFDSTIDSLKERFNNLIELEFNIQNAVQSENSQFLSTIATLFLPISYMASIWGITTITWPAIWYLYAALPVLLISAMFTFLFGRTVRHIQRLMYPIERLQIHFSPRNFTMLGDELPDGVDVPGGQRGRYKNKAQRPTAGDGARSRSRSRRKIKDNGE